MHDAKYQHRRLPNLRGCNQFIQTGELEAEANPGARNSLLELNIVICHPD